MAHYFTVYVIVLEMKGAITPGTIPGPSASIPTTPSSPTVNSSYFYIQEKKIFHEDVFLLICGRKSDLIFNCLKKVETLKRSSRPPCFGIFSVEYTLHK